ncbi:hypothetical protein ACA910_004300 [Epithemia clementina (nom. ined.)]
MIGGFTNEEKAAWALIYNFMGFHMIQGLKAHHDQIAFRKATPEPVNTKYISLHGNKPSFQELTIHLPFLSDHEKVGNNHKKQARLVDLRCQTVYRHLLQCNKKVPISSISYACVHNVASSWQIILNIPEWEKVTGELFIRYIFKLEPKTVVMFGFPSNTDYCDPDLVQDIKFMTKGIVLIKAIDTSVHLLGPDLYPLEDTVLDLGKRHVQMQTQPEHWPIIGEALFLVFEECMGGKFTGEVREAWTRIYNFLGYHMIQGLEAKYKQLEEEGQQGDGDPQAKGDGKNPKSDCCKGASTNWPKVIWNKFTSADDSSSSSLGSSTLSSPPITSTTPTADARADEEDKPSSVWLPYNGSYRNNTNDTSRVRTKRTTNNTEIVGTEYEKEVVSVPRQEEQAHANERWSHFQAQAGLDAASFEPTKFDPWITNCHVQTIGGFFLRDTPAAFLPRDNIPMSLARICSGLLSKVVPPQLLSLLWNDVNVDQTKKVSTQKFWDVRERVETPDGDWFHADTKFPTSSKDYHDVHHYPQQQNTLKNQKGMMNDRRPTRVLLVHGLESNSNSSLSQQIAQACHQQGMTVTCLNFRSCSVNEKGELLPNRLPGGYHLGFTDDLKHYLELNKNKNEDIFLVGFSLGANVVLKALGELGVKAVQEYGIRGAAVACAPFEQETNARALARPGINRLVYTNSLLNSLKRKAVDQWKQFCQKEDRSGDDYDASLSALIVREYEKGPVDRILDSVQDATEVVFRAWNELDSKLREPKEEVVRGVSELADVIGKAVTSTIQNFASESSVPTKAPQISAVPAPSATAKEEPWFMAAAYSSGKQHSESKSGSLSVANVEGKIGDAWKALTVGFSEVESNVTRETIVASGIMGSLLAASTIEGGDHFDVSLLAGMTSAYSAMHGGPVGKAARIMGNVGLSAYVAIQELLNQAREVGQERSRTAKALLAAASGGDERVNGNTNKSELFDLPRALAAKTISEFDDAFIAPIYGFRDCWDYYRNTSSLYYLEDIVVPTLVVNAEDDPFFDPSVYPIEKTVEGGGRAPVKLVRTKAGGHLGFCFQQIDDNEETQDSESGDASGSSWMPSELVRFLQHIQGRRRSKRALLQHLLPAEQLYS